MIHAPENKDKKLKLFLYVAIVAGVIFIIWLFILPYMLSAIKKEDGGGWGIVNEDTKEILSNITESFKEFGSKVGEMATSTEGVATSTDDSIEKLKDKILEKNAE